MPSRATRTVGRVELRRFRVLYVVDGDGFAIADGPHGQARELVRMLCMDAPERDQVGWREAKDALEELIGGKSVRLEPEHRWRYVRDRYGRNLCYVFLGNLLVNAELIRLGWSDYLTKFGRGRYQHVMARCKTEAEGERRGIWRRYERGDSWAWGRGRAKPHFRTAAEFERYQGRGSKVEDVKDGEVSADFRAAARIDSGEHIFSEQGRAVHEAEGQPD